jgi:hypothetical protein
MIAGHESKTVRVRFGCRRDETVHSPDGWLEFLFEPLWQLLGQANV